MAAGNVVVGLAVEARARRSGCGHSRRVPVGTLNLADGRPAALGVGLRRRRLSAHRQSAVFSATTRGRNPASLAGGTGHSSPGRRRFGWSENRTRRPGTPPGRSTLGRRCHARTTAVRAAHHSRHDRQAPGRFARGRRLSNASLPSTTFRSRSSAPKKIDSQRANSPPDSRWQTCSIGRDVCDSSSWRRYWNTRIRSWAPIRVQRTSPRQSARQRSCCSAARTIRDNGGRGELKSPSFGTKSPAPLVIARSASGPTIPAWLASRFQRSSARSSVSGTSRPETASPDGSMLCLGCATGRSI